MKQKKLFVLSNEAVRKLQMLADRNNISNSQMLEALIMLAAEHNLKVSITVRTQYEVIKEGDITSVQSTSPRFDEN